MDKTTPSRLERIKHWYRELPDKKKYLEVITAFLSIPVLLTVLINNTLNLQNQGKNLSPTPTPTVSLLPQNTPQPADQTTPTPVAQTTYIVVPVATPSATPANSPTPAPECTKAVGPVAITYPQENQVIASDPVCVDIERQSDMYCSIVWSYRINDSNWSDYLDKAICLYGLPAGQKQLQIKVKSVVGNDEIVLQRNFTVANPSPSPTATASGTTSGQ